MLTLQAAKVSRLGLQTCNLFSPKYNNNKKNKKRGNTCKLALPVHVDQNYATGCYVCADEGSAIDFSLSGVGVCPPSSPDQRAHPFIARVHVPSEKHNNGVALGAADQQIMRIPPCRSYEM